MRTLEEKNFELMMKFALSCDEMLMVRGGTDGDGDGEGGDPEDIDPEKPPVLIKI